MFIGYYTHKFRLPEQLAYCLKYFVQRAYSLFPVSLLSLNSYNNVVIMYPIYKTQMFVSQLVNTVKTFNVGHQFCHTKHQKV